VLLAALISLVGISAAVSSDRPANPFGEKTVTEFTESLGTIWDALREQIQLDDLIVSSCMENQTDDCAPAKKLMAVVDDARQYQGRAMIAHLNRSINLMIKRSAGSWTSALDILKSGSGDCKNYSVTKYAALLRSGISPSHLKLIIVHDNATKEDHMVVGVYEDGHWLLLDNLTMSLVKDTDRKGYVPMYALDETGVHRYIPGTQSS
jgi:predicted transglutaminase-like cysteine proteinase